MLAQRAQHSGQGFGEMGMEMQCAGEGGVGERK